MKRLGNEINEKELMSLHCLSQKRGGEVLLMAARCMEDFFIKSPYIILSLPQNKAISDSSFLKMIYHSADYMRSFIPIVHSHFLLLWRTVCQLLSWTQR